MSLSQDLERGRFWNDGFDTRIKTIDAADHTSRSRGHAPSVFLFRLARGQHHPREQNHYSLIHLADPYSANELPNDSRFCCATFM